jgi:spore maturation protein CgeB
MLTRNEIECLEDLFESEGSIEYVVSEYFDEIEEITKDEEFLQLCRDYKELKNKIEFMLEGEE